GQVLGIQVSGLKKKVAEVRRLPTLADAAQAVLEGRRTPDAVYQLSLHGECTFGGVQGLVPYLHELGVSDLILSPVLMTRSGKGGRHDICDHGRIHPGLGGEAGLAGLAEAASTHGMA